MQARFLTDLITPDSLNIRTRLNTRRLAGVSQKALPLFEEDVQSHNFQVTADETIVLLPFGRNSDAETLKIEITSKIIDASKVSERERNLPQINIIKPFPNGEINVDAVKVPHRFVAQAILTADGLEIARGSGAILLEETREIILHPDEKSKTEIPAAPLAVKLTVDSFSQTRTTDLVGIAFDAYRLTAGDGDSTPNQFILNGRGIAIPGRETKYNLSSTGWADNKNYELKLVINLGEEEKND
jgi:hypothetical protein